MASQLFSLAKPSFHLTERIIHIDLCVPELDTLVKDMENTWRRINQMSDQEILNCCKKYSERFQALDAKYLNSLDLPENQHCKKIAMQRRDHHLSTYLAITKEEATIGT